MSVEHGCDDGHTTPPTVMSLGDIDLADIRGFWGRPIAEREAAFSTLRLEAPIRFFAERPLRAAGRDVALAGRGFWAITRHADVAEISRRPGDFCSSMGTAIFDQPPEMLDFFGGMINMDNPRHARLRRIVQKGFTPRSLERLDRHIVTLAEKVTTNAARLGEFDFVTEVAAKLPLAVICDLMGIPDVYYDDVLRLTNIILSAGDPEYLPTGTDPIAAYVAAGAEMAAIVEEVATRRRTDPTEDLVSALVHGEVDGEQLTQQELSSFFVLLCTAGNETTRNSISHGVLALDAWPDERCKWMADFDVFSATAIDEIIRWATPVIYFRRTVTRDGVRLGDHEFAEGDKVVLYYNSANRDGDVFDEPYRFDVGRAPNPHVAFGAAGPHFCLGAHLARREMTVLFRELFRTMPSLHPTADAERLRSNFIHGIKHLVCSV